MAERGDLVSQIVNGESEDDIEEDTDSEVELLVTSNSDRRGDLSNKYPGDDAGDLDSTPVTYQEHRPRRLAQQFRIPLLQLSH